MALKKNQPKRGTTRAPKGSGEAKKRTGDDGFGDLTITHVGPEHVPSAPAKRGGKQGPDPVNNYSFDAAADNKKTRAVRPPDGVKK